MFLHQKFLFLVPPWTDDQKCATLGVNLRTTAIIFQLLFSRKVQQIRTPCPIIFYQNSFNCYKNEHIKGIFLVKDFGADKKTPLISLVSLPCLAADTVGGRQKFSSKDGTANNLAWLEFTLFVRTHLSNCVIQAFISKQKSNNHI